MKRRYQIDQQRAVHQFRQARRRRNGLDENVDAFVFDEAANMEVAVLMHFRKWLAWRIYRRKYAGALAIVKAANPAGHKPGMCDIAKADMHLIR